MLHPPNSSNASQSCAQRSLSQRLHGAEWEEGPSRRLGLRRTPCSATRALKLCAVEGAEQEALCGEATELCVVPAGALAAHRSFLGSEKVHAHVRGEAQRWRTCAP